MVNSSWTCAHIAWFWRWGSPKPIVVYPPVAVEDFALESLTDLQIQQRNHTKEIISVAQFRPEKDHELQLKAFSELLHHKKYKNKYNEVKLLLLGSCRDTGDVNRVAELKKLAKELNIQNVSTPFLSPFFFKKKEK